MDHVLKFFKTSWLHEGSVPRVIYTSPDIFARDVSRKPDIIVEVVDYASGINYSSLVLLVNGYNVIEASTVIPILGGFRVTYTPLFSFYWGSEVQISVRASNNSGYYMSDYTYYFTVISRKINTMVEEALLDISRAVDWSELE